MRRGRCVLDRTGRKSSRFGLGSLRQALFPRSQSHRNRQVGSVGHRFSPSHEQPKECTQESRSILPEIKLRWVKWKSRVNSQLRSPWNVPTRMPEIKRLKKRLDFSTLPSDWRLAVVPIDWQGKPLVLLRKAGPHARTDAGMEATVKWMNTPPKRHHLLHWGRNSIPSLV